MKGAAGFPYLAVAATSALLSLTLEKENLLDSPLLPLNRLRLTAGDIDTLRFAGSTPPAPVISRFYPEHRLCRLRCLGVFNEMEFLEFGRFKINPTALECRICRLPPKPHCDGPHLYLCDAGHLVCRFCMPVHKASCGGSSSSNCCRMLENIASRIEIKCACGVYVRYCELKEHHNGCRRGKFCTSAWRKCRLWAAHLRCSICGATLRPPIFKPCYRDLLFCADCTKDNFDSCPDLDYLFKCIMVETLVPYCSPCDEDGTNSAVAGSNIIIGKTNGKAPSKVGKMDKHIVECREPDTGKRVAEASLKTSTYNQKANIAMASGKKIEEYESIRPPAGNSTNIGKSKGKAPPKVRKMDNHIVDSDVVESDDDSSDDIHSETGKRVAETALGTSAYNKKAKIATPSGGQKTDEYESTRPSAGNCTNIGNSKGNDPPKVRKMDNHIVDSDVVESDDDSSDDIHTDWQESG